MNPIRSILFCITLVCTLSAIIAAQTVGSISLSTAIDADGIKAGPDGYIYLAGGWNSSLIHRADMDGNVSTFASGFQGPIDMAFGEGDTMYVTNWTGNSVSKVAPDGQVSAFVSLPGAPSGITIDQDGDLYVSQSPATIRKITPDGTHSVFASGGTINEPVGITFDGDGNFYAANLYDGRITKVDAAGSQSLLATVPSSGQFRVGHLKYIQGYLYATALSNHRIYRISLQGDVVQFAGTGVAGQVDGSAGSAQFRNPNGITPSLSGDSIFVIGTLASTSSIRVISGIVSSISGEVDALPQNFNLHQNSPNPFNPRTRIRYDIAKSDFVIGKVFNSRGQEIKTLVNQWQQAGSQVVEWDGTDNNNRTVSSGIYFYLFQTSDQQAARKMILLQ